MSSLFEQNLNISGMRGDISENNENAIICHFERPLKMA